jgi:hypothetical protein
MEFALARAGLRPLNVTHPGGRYSVAYLAHKLRTFADVSVLRAASARIASGRTGAVSVPINLFDIMTVVARREESLS